VLLTTTERKIELLTQMAPELRVIVQPFDEAFAKIEAEAFVSDILLKQVKARYILVGKNFHFGRGRRGNHDLLKQWADQLGYTAEAFELSGDVAGTYSSSRARSELLAGRLDNVTQVLGRPHTVSGVVVAGDGRGRALGYPTANLAEVAEALPPAGVYTCIVDLLPKGEHPTRLGYGAMSIGLRPTVNRGFAVEVHLLDKSGDLYARRLRVHLIHRLRSIEKFENLDALQAQMRADVEITRDRLDDWTRANRAPSV
jgi:riboflavin kinase / FMN adenylyltransferase